MNFDISALTFLPDNPDQTVKTRGQEIIFYKNYPSRDPLAAETRPPLPREATVPSATSARRRV